VWKNEVIDLMDQIGGMRPNCGYSTISLNDVLKTQLNRWTARVRMLRLLGLQCHV